jgi:D-3-phosphoglycerate dehydrogenase / 2-oxoglutarate reductase
VLQAVGEAGRSGAPRPKLLCMVDLSMAPEAKAAIEAAARVDYAPAEHARLCQCIGAYDAFWGHTNCRVDREVLERAARLKVVNTASTGTDHIDVAECERRGVQVLSITRDYDLLDMFTATAECAWMLLLNCMRHFPAAREHVLAGHWRGELFCGRQLSQRTMGVLGVGRLGRMTVEYARAFRMRVLGCDLKPVSIPGVERVDFATLLRQSDCLSIHIHLTEQSRHLFNAAAFAAMKPGAVLVNTSRGDIIDEAALLAALASGRLAAFGADVLHDEWRADMGESPVVQYARTHPNVVLTPHIGGHTDLSVHDARVFSARKLARFLESLRPNP